MCVCVCVYLYLYVNTQTQTHSKLLPVNCMFHHHCTVVPTAEILCITQRITWKEKQTSSHKQTTGIRESYDTNFKYSVLNREKYSSSPYLLTYLLTHSMVQSTSWEANWFAASQEIPTHFTEPEGSLQHSQASATCLYPGPAQSSPYTHIPPPGDPS